MRQRVSLDFMPTYVRSAFKHGFSERDIQGVLDDPFRYKPITTQNNRPGLSYLGLARDGTMIEVIGEYRDSGDLAIYHVQKASRNSYRRF